MAKTSRLSQPLICVFNILNRHKEVFRLHIQFFENIPIYQHLLNSCTGIGEKPTFRDRLLTEHRKSQDYVAYCLSSDDGNEVFHTYGNYQPKDLGTTRHCTEGEAYVTLTSKGKLVLVQVLRELYLENTIGYLVKPNEILQEIQDSLKSSLTPLVVKDCGIMLDKSSW